MTEWDILATSYARLTALRKNLADESDVEVVYLAEYHSVLRSLSDLGYDVAAFRIPPEAAQPRVVAIYRPTVRSRGGAQYSDKRYVPGLLFRTRLDGLLALFSLMEERPPIGFNAPRG